MRMTDELRAVITQQWGVVARAQLAEAGVTHSELRWRLGRDWQIVLPGVYKVDRSPCTQAQRQVAALLYAGDRALLAGATAAHALGVTAANAQGTVRIDVPAPAHCRRLGWLDARRTRVPDARPRPSGVLLYVSAPRAVVEAGREAATSERTRAIVIEAVQRGIVTVEQLAHENQRLGQRGSGEVRRAIQEAAAGAWSVPEAEVGRLVRRSAVLPPMLANPVLIAGDGRRLISPDGWFDDVGLAVMVHSQTHHTLHDAHERTVARDGELAAVGILVVAVTPRAVARDPDACLHRIEGAYRSAKALNRVRPAVHAIPRFGEAWPQRSA